MYRMEHNLQLITMYLSENGVDCSVQSDGKELTTKHRLGLYDVEIRAVLPDDFPCSLPCFHLVDRFNYGALAHVAWGKNNYASICYGSNENFSADFNNPGIVFLASLEKALVILDKSLNDNLYNEVELKREFADVWRFHANSEKNLICIAEPVSEITELTIRYEVKNAKLILDTKTYAIAPNINECNAGHRLLQNSRNNNRIIKGKGVLVPISHLLPPPSPNESIENWWRRQLTELPEDYQRNLSEYSRKNKARELFIICNAEVAGSKTLWFGIYCTNLQKQNLPLTIGSISGWAFDAIQLDIVSKEMLITRGGGALELNKLNACVVGCGSLGGYISDMLASSGIGKLTLVDYDVYKIENMHRHILDPTYLFFYKNDGLKFDLEYKYPFLNVSTNTKRLLEISEVEFWNKFDVIIIAIGSPTHERKFNEFVRKNGIKPPVIYTWNEPFGIGGHALANFSDKTGCLACAYINNETDEPDLYPNINFIARNQRVMKNIGGCGTEFLAFSAIDSMQTAAIATKLALRCVRGELEQGVSVSWKGQANMTEQVGIELTHRYWHFNSNLKDIPLERSACDICHE